MIIFVLKRRFFVLKCRSFWQTILENLPTNLRYHLRVAGITQSIFQKNKMFYVGDFTETYRFQLYGKIILW